MSGSLSEALVRSAFIALDGTMDGHDQLAVAALLPSGEEYAEGLLEERGDATEAEALLIGFEIRRRVLEQLEYTLTEAARSAEETA